MKKDTDIKELLIKAKESHNAAKSLFENGFYDFSAGRSYYTMFYATEAVLLTKDLSFSKHKAVIAAFGKEFVKSGIFSEQLYRYLIDAFDMRTMGDYGPSGSISKDKALQLIKYAEDFIKTIEEYFK